MSYLYIPGFFGCNLTGMKVYPKLMLKSVILTCSMIPQMRMNVLNMHYLPVGSLNSTYSTLCYAQMQGISERF